MAPIKRKRATQPAAVLAACALASIGIAACGGGSSKNASANGATSTSTSTSTTGSAAGAARFAAMRNCLRKEGITLPQRRAFQHSNGGAAGAPGGGFPGGGGGFGRHLPKGVSAEKLQSALKKCGGDFPGGFRGGFHGGRGGVFKSAKDKTALTTFAACMRENGVKLPAPNTSGQGPVFDTKGLDTSSSQFKSAVEKCHSKLPGPFADQGGPPPSGGA